MLRRSLGVFVVALIAAVFGFTGIAASASDIARICFFFFLVVFEVALMCGLGRGRKMSMPS